MPPPDPSSPRKRYALPLACFVAGCSVVGFVAGVLSLKGAQRFVAGLFESERAATVEQTITVNRPAFRFEYPGNWRIDITDSDYDPDHMFSVDSPGQSFVMFAIAEGELEPEMMVEKQVAAQLSRTMKDGAKTPLSQWGTRSVKGALLKGKYLGIAPGTIRVVAFRGHQKTYTIIESTYDEDRAMVQAGFDLIARTFHLKGPSSEGGAPTAGGSPKGN